MFVCENGHYLGKKSKACACGGSVWHGAKVSLFLPDPLHKEIAADARTIGESLSAQIVRHISRDRNRKRPKPRNKRSVGADV